MCKATEHAWRQPETTVQFVLTLLKRRLDDEDNRIPLDNNRSILDLSAISQDAYDSLMAMISHALLGFLGEWECLYNSSPGWLKDATTLLLSTSEHPLPQLAISALRRSLDDAPSSGYPMRVLASYLTSERGDDWEFTPLAKHFAVVFGGTEKPGNLYSVWVFYDEVIGAITSGEEREAYMQLWNRYAPRPARDSSGNTQLHTLLNDFMDITASILRMEATTKFGCRVGADDILFGMMALTAEMGRKEDATDVLRLFWSHKERDRSDLVLLCCGSPKYRLNKSSIMQDAFFHADVEGIL